MARTGVFDRVICGVEGSPAGLEAVRQATLLVAPGGTLLLASVVHLAEAAKAGWDAARIACELEREAGEALARARELAPEAEARLLDGPVVRTLLAEIERVKATLLCVGTHGMSRPEGIVLGGVTTTMLHEAPCAVLVARPPADPSRFPRSVAVGVDGSSESALAVAVATELAERFGVGLHGVVATGAKRVDVAAARTQLATVEEKPGAPVDALVEASEAVDLLVVGSRGLHGIRALGSVSERIAHRARCSVLVARGASR